MAVRTWPWKGLLIAYAAAMGLNVALGLLWRFLGVDGSLWLNLGVGLVLGYAAARWRARLREADAVLALRRAMEEDRRA